MTSNEEKKALIESLFERVTEARRKSLGYMPNIFILVNENEFIQMVGHELLGGDIKTPRYKGFRVKVAG